MCKGSLIVVREMCENLGQSLDQELSVIFNALMRKVSDSNTLIAEEATRGLESLCRYCKLRKIKTLLMTQISERKNP